MQLPVMGGTVVVDAVLPDGGSRTVLTPQLAGLQTGMDYVVMAVGKVADGSLSSLLVPAAATVPTSGNALVQVVHAAAGAPTVDVHVTTPGAPLSSGTVTATLPFKQFTGRVRSQLVTTKSGLRRPAMLLQSYLIPARLISVRGVIYSSPPWITALPAIHRYHCWRWSPMVTVQKLKMSTARQPCGWCTRWLMRPPLTSC